MCVRGRQSVGPGGVCGLAGSWRMLARYSRDMAQPAKACPRPRPYIHRERVCLLLLSVSGSRWRLTVGLSRLCNRGRQRLYLGPGHCPEDACPLLQACSFSTCLRHVLACGCQPDMFRRSYLLMESACRPEVVLLRRRPACCPSAGCYPSAGLAAA